MTPIPHSGFWRDLLRHPRSRLREYAFWQTHRQRVVEAIDAELRHRERLAAFAVEYRAFKELSDRAPRPFLMSEENSSPCLDDRSAETPFDRHYTYHPAWAARILARTRPARHVDVGSILSFAAVLSAFIPVEHLDIRPAPLTLDNLQAAAADLLNLDRASASIQSISCMHVIEQIGLGRYGDPLDPDGDRKAIRDLMRVLAPCGNLLIAVPVGQPQVRFNAHRIYDHEAFRDCFTGLDLVEFGLIADADAPGGVIDNPPPDLVRAQSYGCGCYWFRKPGPPGHAED